MNKVKTVCYYFMECLAQSSCNIWILSDSNGIQTHKHLVRKRILNNLAKLAEAICIIVALKLQ